MESLSTKAKAFLYTKIRLAWRYYSENRKKILEAKSCVLCHKKSKLYADHIEPIGSFKPEEIPYIQKVFCDIKNLQPICKPCHSKKTKEERAKRKKAA